MKTELRKAQAEEKNKSERLELLRHAVFEVLGKLPSKELSEFDFAKWLKSDPKYFGTTIDECLRGTENNWLWLLHHLNQLKSKDWPEHFNIRCLVGLPLDRELERQQTKQAAVIQAAADTKLAEQHENDKATKEKLKSEKAEAHTLLKTDLLHQVLEICRNETKAQLWCNSTNPKFDNRKPYDYCDTKNKVLAAVQFFKDSFKKNKCN